MSDEGVDESKVNDLLKSFEKSEQSEKISKTEKEEKVEKTVAKYFIHGFAFSVLFTILVILWIFGIFVLTVLGAIIGFIIGLVILMFIMGGLNSYLTGLLWFPVKTSFLDVVVHGIALFIALLTVNSVVLFLPSIAFPGLATTIAIFILGAFIDGFICKHVAMFWEEEPYITEQVPESVKAEWKEKEL
jgi:cation transport ATPase